MERLYIIAAAFVLDLVFADPTRMPHPVRIIGWCINRLEGVIRKVFKSRSGLKVGGVLLTVVIVAGVYYSTWVLLAWLWTVNPYICWAVEILLAYQTMAAACLAGEGKKIYDILENGPIDRARKQLSYIVGRDTRALSEGQVVKATVETVAENTLDGVIAPLFYLFIGGVPLAMAYKAVNTLDSMVGYKNDKYIHLGWAAARLDDVLNFIPARITGIIMIVVSMMGGYNYKDSLRIFKRDRKNHPSPNSAHPEAAIAGALGIALGGDGVYSGKRVEKPVIGDDKIPIDRVHINHGIRIMYGCAIVAMAAFSLIYLVLVRVAG